MSRANLLSAKLARGGITAARSVTAARSPASVREPTDIRSRIGTGWEAPALLTVTLMLLGIGLVQVYSASSVMAIAEKHPDYHYVVKQLTGAAAGFGLLACMALVDYRRLRMLAWPMLIIVVVALLVMVVPGMPNSIVPLGNGARRWLYIGPVGLQPSEFAKLSLIIWTAALAVKKQDKLSSLSRGLMPFLVMWCAVAGLVMLQPSYSAAVLILLLAALVVFAAGARIGHFIVLGLIGLPILWTQLTSAAYRSTRILTFLHRDEAAAAAGYQINQALIAVGSGGLFGVGFGHGQQKFGFLPEPHNDFLFAMLSEEWGMVGGVIVVGLFAAFALIGYRIARDAEDMFGFLLAIGITNLVVVHALLHFLINLALVPTTGVTLPFMSYGRSSLLVCMAGVGILMSVARRAQTRIE
ncbi:MAG: putative peptidoglycan glycosyltransferase FtsW [Longimicrobiales bacterium]